MYTGDNSKNDFVCLWVFVPLENFELIWRRHQLQILTYTRHSWPLHSKGSLAYHIFFETGHTRVYNGNLRGPTLKAERFAVELSLPVFMT